MLLIKQTIILLMLLTLLACENSSTTEVESSLTSPQVTAGSEPDVADVEQDDEPLSETERMENSIADLEAQMGIRVFEEPWTGDLDTMVEHRIIRVLTVYGLGRYFLDGPQEKGITYDWFKMFETALNKRLQTKHLIIHVVFIPVSRDQLIPALLSGRGDIVAAGMTITPERAELIDFSNPVTKELNEVLVTGGAAPEIGSLNDLAGRKVHVRASSSYRSSLIALNLQFQQQGLEEIEIKDVPELLEDEDILEMVNAGLLEWAVVDDYKAKIWADVFENLTVRSELVFRSGGKLGLGMRKNSPKLAAELNEFIKTHKQGSLKGNILINRYFKNFDWTTNALSANDYQRFRDVADIFSKFGEQYGIDYLMVAAQGYQESRLDQSAKSAAGAIGIMQLLPSTAADSNVGIPDITTAEANIHAGIKYLNFIRDRYFSDPEMDNFNRTMFAFAAYNAGPARIRKLRTKAAEQGYDPNLWFDNVEVMAAKDIGRETVQYVSNILKYYVAYSLSTKKQLERDQARNKAGIN
jgi:membrane-bound lytic murein transglycosylase MltF